jgi:hypothetical protein
MDVHDAKAYIGKAVEVEYTDRLGRRASGSGTLLDVEYVPMYGSSLVLDFGEIGLERVVSLSEATRRKPA